MLTILQRNVNSRYRVSMWLPSAKAQQAAQNLKDKVIRGAGARDDLDDGGSGLCLPSQCLGRTHGVVVGRVDIRARYLVSPPLGEPPQGGQRHRAGKGRVGLQVIPCCAV